MSGLRATRELDGLPACKEKNQRLRDKLNCEKCPPNRGENAKRDNSRARRGKAKRKEHRAPPRAGAERTEKE